MSRLASLLVAVVAVGVVGLAGCSKPSEADCRKALANMQRLMGTDNLRDDGRIEGEVRRCKGGSKKKAVACAIKATTLDELRSCEFFHVPLNFTPPTAGSGGSGAVVPPTGSGAAGSAAGSAAAGSGSAAGSAAAGSAAGPGSASGSAAPGGSAAAPGGSAASPGAAAGSAATSAGSAVGSAK